MRDCLPRVQTRGYSDLALSGHCFSPEYSGLLTRNSGLFHGGYKWFAFMELKKSIFPLAPCSTSFSLRSLQFEYRNLRLGIWNLVLVILRSPFFRLFPIHLNQTRCIASLPIHPMTPFLLIHAFLHYSIHAFLHFLVIFTFFVGAS